MRKRSLFALLAIATLAAAVAAGLGSSVALAGEVTGNCNNAKEGSKAAENCKTDQNANANSICSFSGQEDDSRSPLRTQTPAEVWLSPEELDPENPENFPDGLVVNPPPGTPGHECNGNANGLKN
jgi:hypothetical protein